LAAEVFPTPGILIVRILGEAHVTWKSHRKSYRTRETNRRSGRERQDRKPGQSITENLSTKGQ